MDERSKGMSTFGVWLKTVLNVSGMKQRDLAKIIGKTEVSVSRWIHGDRTPKWNELDKILDYFGYHIEIVPNGFRRS